MSVIGTITIGQSPRADILPDFEAALGRKLEIKKLSWAFAHPRRMKMALFGLCYFGQ
jgi:hypothetical protein